MKQLEKLLGNKIEKLSYSKQEIDNLMDIVKRDISDAEVKEISNDRRYAAAYNAVLQLCTMLIRKKGYRIRKTGHHYNTFRAAGLLLGKTHEMTINYFDSCRIKRNRVEYDYVLNISDTELDELIYEAKKFKKVILNLVE